MKITKNFKFIFILYFFGLISCKAQQILPLNTSDYSASESSYFKDLNNELNPYIGTWKSNFQGKSITLIITKELERPYIEWNKNFYADVLIIRYTIKDSNGNELQTTLASQFTVGGNVKNLMMSVGTNIRGNNEVDIVYAGGNCGVGGGEISLKQINSSQIYWSYYPGVTALNDITCPPNLDYHIYLPETENLVFTKQ